jgi:transcriptional regulator with XRE-family HTH domain
LRSFASFCLLAAGIVVNCKTVKEVLLLAHIGDKLKTLRKGRKLTQDQVAEAFGVTRGAISNFEIGKRQPDIKTLQAFATFYGVPLDYFGESEQKDELFDLLSRAKVIFHDERVSRSTKEELYREFMKLYLELDKK